MFILFCFNSKRSSITLEKAELLSKTISFKTVLKFNSPKQFQREYGVRHKINA